MVGITRYDRTHDDLSGDIEWCVHNWMNAYRMRAILEMFGHAYGLTIKRMVSHMGNADAPCV